MIEITKIIEWDMGHRVPNHRSKCRNLHGHRYRMEMTISGKIIDKPGDSSEGMVLDFGDLKSTMMMKIHDTLDHGCMIYDQDLLLTGFFESCAHENLRVIKVPFIPTAENIAEWCFEQLCNSIPAGVKIVNIRLYETPNSWADYKPDGSID